jgi:serine/threonine protein kinase
MKRLTCSVSRMQPPPEKVSLVSERPPEEAHVISNQPLLAKRFQLIKVAGSGGASAVFHVRDTERDGEEVALKVLTNRSAFDALTIARFEAEVGFLREINHPNIVRAYDFISLGHTIAYTMELVRGRELSRFLSPGALSLEMVDTIFRQLLSALHELHSRGVFHRDLKLENLLYTEGFGIKLMDFGLMKLQRNSPDTQAGVLLGTAQYLPPEYIQTGHYDARSDLYCVGILLFEVLSGARWLANYSGDKSIDYLVECNFNVPHELPSKVPRKYQRIVDKAMMADAKRRYQSAYEMLIAFNEEPSVNGTLTGGPGRKSTDPFFSREGFVHFIKDPVVILLFGIITVLGLVFVFDNQPF